MLVKKLQTPHVLILTIKTEIKEKEVPHLPIIRVRAISNKVNPSKMPISLSRMTPEEVGKIKKEKTEEMLSQLKM